jgi:hypothetical protein
MQGYIKPRGVIASATRSNPMRECPVILPGNSAKDVDSFRGECSLSWRGSVSHKMIEDEAVRGRRRAQEGDASSCTSLPSPPSSSP